MREQLLEKTPGNWPLLPPTPPLSFPPQLGDPQGLLGSKHRDLLARIYLRPLRHFPLWPTSRVLADFPLFWPSDVSRFAQVAVDGAVQARREHLPATDNPELVAFSAGPGTLAPAAGLPPVQHKVVFQDEEQEGQPGQALQG